MSIATGRPRPEHTFPMVSDKLYRELFPWLERKTADLVSTKMTGVLNGWDAVDFRIGDKIIFVSDDTFLTALRGVEDEVREICGVVANECLTLLRDEAAQGTSIEALACECDEPADPIDACTYHRMTHYVELLLRGLTTQ